MPLRMRWDWLNGQGFDVPEYVCMYWLVKNQHRL